MPRNQATSTSIKSGHVVLLGTIDKSIVFYCSVMNNLSLFLLRSVGGGTLRRGGPYKLTDLSGGDSKKH
jgi:hypothetical protein